MEPSDGYKELQQLGWHGYKTVSLRGCSRQLGRKKNGDEESICVTREHTVRLPQHTILRVYWASSHSDDHFRFPQGTRSKSERQQHHLLSPVLTSPV